jgi:hypothetical protein
VNHIPPEANRREFFAGVLRYGTLVFLAGAGGLAIVKRQRLVREGKCINDGLCLGCAIYGGCDLPAALKAKQSSEGGEHGPTK